MTEQRAKRCGNWEDRLPSLFLKVLRFWGESNIAWQKGLCATTPGRWRRAAQENQWRQAEPCTQDPWRTLSHMVCRKNNACTAQCMSTIFRQYPSGHRPDVFKDLCWAFFLSKAVTSKYTDKTVTSNCVTRPRLIPRHLTTLSDLTSPHPHPNPWSLWWAEALIPSSWWSWQSSQETLSTHTALKTIKFQSQNHEIGACHY